VVSLDGVSAVTDGLVLDNTALAGWLRGDFDTTREHVADVVAALLLATADVSTALPGSGNAVER
jgi:hypothetical protein